MSPGIKVVELFWPNLRLPTTYYAWRLPCTLGLFVGFFAHKDTMIPAMGFFEHERWNVSSSLVFRRRLESKTRKERITARQCLKQLEIRMRRTQLTEVRSFLELIVLSSLHYVKLTVGAQIGVLLNRENR